MGKGNYNLIHTVSYGEKSSSEIRNNEHLNHINNCNPDGVDDASANLAEMTAIEDPYPLEIPSLATAERGELERLRYQIKNITGEDQWYYPASKNLKDLERDEILINKKVWYDADHKLEITYTDSVDWWFDQPGYNAGQELFEYNYTTLSELSNTINITGEIFISTATSYYQVFLLLSETISLSTVSITGYADGGGTTQNAKKNIAFSGSFTFTPGAPQNFTFRVASKKISTTDVWYNALRQESDRYLFGGKGSSFIKIKKLALP